MRWAWVLSTPFVGNETRRLYVCVCVTLALLLCAPSFSSAKVLVKGEPNVSYICSRYYRAPELIFGATDYTSSIGVWDRE